jgi:hypothetical protein
MALCEVIFFAQLLETVHLRLFNHAKKYSPALESTDEYEND